MTLHQFAPISPVVFSTLFIALGGLFAWRLRAAQRASGRREVERRVAARGEALLSLEDVPFNALTSRTGLVGAPMVFRVRTRTADGAEASFEWAYEHALVGHRARGLKRLAHGIWIPLT